MNGGHDLGGSHGYGEIDRGVTTNFTGDWETSVFSLTLACGMLGRWNLDQSRFARENCSPADYLSASYYEHWLHGLESLLLEQGLVTEQELQGGSSQGQSNETAVDPEKMDKILNTGAPTLMNDRKDPAFKNGDQVMVVNSNSLLHTRAPGYVRSRVGRIVSHHGSHVFADEHAASGNKVAEHLYGVRFEACELWGTDKTSQDAVYLDLFEPYLITLDEHLRQLGDKT